MKKKKEKERKKKDKKTREGRRKEKERDWEENEDKLHIREYISHIERKYIILILYVTLLIVIN
jgi:hypothetical protein